MRKHQTHHSAKKKRKRRVSSRIQSSPERPRLAVHRSNKHIYAQIIDDQKGHTLVALSDQGLEKEKLSKLTQTEIARIVGRELAKIALRENIEKVVLDRGPYRYHGRVKALTEGAREGGLTI